MDILLEIVSGMDRGQVRNLKTLLTRSQSDESRKDIELFTYIRKNKSEFSEDKIFKKLYPDETDRNSFYQLKARLLEATTLSIFEQIHEKGSVNACLYFLVLANYYMSKAKFKIALYFFKKAEKKGIESEKYSLLDMIYHQMTIAAKYQEDKTPEFYIAKRRENLRALVKIAEIDNILLETESQLKASLVPGSSQDALKILNDLVGKYKDDPDLKGSVRLQIGLYQTISRIFLENGDYENLESYLQTVLTEFEKKKYFTEVTHRHKLQILAWLSNALFINAKYKQSLKYVLALHQEMLQYDKKYYDRYEFFYHTCLVNNYSKTNPDRAIEILLALIKKEEKIYSYDELFVFINLISLYYRQKEYSKAIKYLQLLYTRKSFGSLSRTMRLRILTGEFMIRLERGERETLEMRFRQVKNILNSGSEQENGWELDYLNHIRYLLGVNAKISDPAFRKAVKHTIAKIESSETKYSEKEDMPFPYTEWLSRRIGL